MPTPNSLNLEALQRAANEARGLAMDAVHACGSGHLGLPLGCAEMGAVLYGHALHICPSHPDWMNRDRFVLSAGHGSMFLYAWLHLSGFDLSLDEIKNFRQMGSKTPGHPEFRETPGVEATTGPLGQGVGNAVGMALAERMLAARYNTPEHPIFHHKVICLAGDGCLQEGISAEASAFAGHQRLGNLILIYDSNEVTLDAMADATQSEDTAARYLAYGWDVTQVDGHDMTAFLAALEAARSNTSGRPQFLVAKTLIGRGISEVAGTSKAHGEGGAKFVDAARRALGLPEQPFFVSKETRAFFRDRLQKQQSAYSAWQGRFEAWADANPEKASELRAAREHRVPDDLMQSIPAFDPSQAIATRKAGSVVLQPIAKAMPNLMSGSADLHGSTLNYIADAADQTPDHHEGRNVRFGIREHGMGAILNGIAYDGIFRASGATFLVFSDYMRPSIRLAALSHLPVTYIFTHDSVGVGEDGPTHQPVETVSALRLIPGLDVIRPADPEETAGAFVAAMQHTTGPTALILSRQSVPTLADIPVGERRHGVLRGAYVAIRETTPLETILLASGSELQHALSAASTLGPSTRVVSVPCMERFDREPAAYREELLPPSCTRRVAIEAGVTGLWYKYVGSEGSVVGIDRFGISAPGAEVLAKLGITPEALIDAARAAATV